MKWIRGDISFIFRGESGGDVYIVDHKKQTVEKAFVPPSKSLDQTTIPENEVRRMMTREITRSAPLMDNVVFSASKTWLGYDKTEKIGHDGWKAKVFNFEGFDLRVINRKKVKRKGDIDVVSATEVKQELLDKCEAEDTSLHGLMFPNEEFSEKHKTYKGTAWISDEFPRTVEELLPIFETLAPTQKHFDKMNKFITMKLPTCGFPVKLNIPCFPTVTASVTFLTHKEIEVDEEKFELPAAYKRVDFKVSSTVARDDDVEANDGEDGDGEEDNEDDAVVADNIALTLEGKNTEDK
jgi:hypothetical protein